MRPPLFAAVLFLTALAGCTQRPIVTPTDMMHVPGMTHGGTLEANEGGQAAFAALEEIVTLLEADPATNWTRVNLTALREHFVDMDEVTLHATVRTTAVPGGFEANVTGTGRTRDAAQRMVPEHAAFLAGHRAWNLSTKVSGDGVVLDAVSADPREAAHLRGLGFFGLLVTDAHHEAHHVMIALGETPHPT